MSESKELQVKQKQEVTTPVEQVKPGLVFTPKVDIFETENEITLLADVPGVAKDDIQIDLNNELLTLTADVKPWEVANESDVMVEFEIGKYNRQFILSEVIDQSRIDAKQEEGVLRLKLPKADKAKPRRITVTAG